MNNYPFCKFQIQEKKKKIIWEITNQCNYSCEYCIFSSTGKKPIGELSFDKIKKTLEELKLLNFNYIKFTGGEPFLHKNFIEILKYAKGLNFNFDISTNASLITESISKELSRIKPNFIHVSIDGHNELVHDSVRGKNSFNKTLLGLFNILKYNKNIRVGCVIHLNNENKLQEMVDFVNSLNIQEIIFSVMSPIGKLKNKTAKLTTLGAEELILKIKNIISKKTIIKHNITSNLNPIIFKNKQINKKCPGVTKFLFINSIGIVSPCTWVSDKQPEFHHLSLQHNSLKEILNHNTFKTFEHEKNKLINKCFAFEYKSNHKFNKIYAFATENISFINDVNIKNNNYALTITGSGDQAILLSKKFKHVDCLDLNPLSNYFAELKIAAIKAFNFNEFILFFKNNKESLSFKQYKRIQHLLSPECNHFWNNQYSVNQHNGQKIRNSNIFSLLHDNWENKTNNVPFIKEEIEYLNIQLKISSTIFTFITDDIQSYQGKYLYDLILLSNIADYSHKMFTGDYLQEFKYKIVEPMVGQLSNGGVMMFAYIYDYENLNNSQKRNLINIKENREKYFSEFNYFEKIIKSAILNLNYDVTCYIKGRNSGK